MTGNAHSVEDIADDKPKTRLTFAAAWSATFVALTGLWHFGYCVGSINSAYAPITEAIRRHYEERWQSNASTALVQGVYVTASTMFPVGGMFGSLLVHPMVTKFGRLRGLLFGHIAVIFFSILMALTDVLKSPEILIISRFGLGLTAGAVGSGISMMYLIEISPRHLRGVFGTISSVQISVGVTMANFLGLPEVLGTANLWPVLLALTGLPSLIFIALFRTLSRSPRELYIDKGNPNEAAKVLRKLNGTEEVEDILQELEEEKTLNAEPVMTIKQILLSSVLRNTLIAALVVSAAGQLNGVNGVLMNFNNILLLAGVKADKAAYAVIGLSASSVCIQIVVTYLVEKYGRKMLLLIGYLLQGFFLVLLTICMETQKLNTDMAYVSIAASFGFYFAFAIGPGPVTLTIVAEFFDQKSRPGGMAVSVVVYWLGFAATSIVTPYMLNSIGGYTFITYAVLSLLSALFIRFRVPETKNRPFTEIQREFRCQKEVKKSEILRQRPLAFRNPGAAINVFATESDRNVL